MNYLELIDQCLKDKLIRIVLSRPVKPDEISQIKIRPIVVKDKMMYQITKATGSKKTNNFREVHENMNSQNLAKELSTLIPGFFLQGLFECEEYGYTVLANKKGTITVVKNKSVTGKLESMDHNRTKNYLIKEGTFVPFLFDLGVMTRDGRIVKSKYDKFRQINRYLEFADDVYDSFDKSREITIIDFGCGKSYLTFALYYYLVELKKLNAHIIGLDLKPEVINDCTRLKNKYGYKGLEFIQGDIEHFDKVKKVDMVITLHACDTATDYAIYKAIKWDALVVMAVPCCQHELNKKIDAPMLYGATQYGILKERLSAIFTDAIRANTLTEAGYDAQILEFIDMDHTPKNLLIRAVKSNRIKARSLKPQNNEKLNEVVGSTITLQNLMQDIDS